MKLVHSLWTYPIRSTKEQHIRQHRLEAGWPATRYHYLSWTLSCLLAKKHYDTIDLYVDEYGKELLIDTLELPYTNVHVALNDLEKHYSPNLWTIGKTETFRLMDTPFLHLDSDVYLFDNINPKVLEGGLICQNLTHNLPYYNNIFKEINQYLEYCPDYLKHPIETDLISINAGVSGGNNIKKIQEIADEVFHLIHANKHCIHKVNNDELTLIIDQYMYYRLFDKNEITCIFDDVPEGFVEVLQWHTIPQRSQYIHALGYSKRNPHTVAQLEARLAFHFPEEYARVTRKLKINNILENPTPETERRFMAFQTLANTSVNTTLEKPILLSPSHFITDAHIEHKTTRQKTTFEGLDHLLTVFQEPTTMMEVINYLLSQDDTRSKNEIQEQVYNFITDKIIYHDQLTFV